MKKRGKLGSFLAGMVAMALVGALNITAFALGDPTTLTDVYLGGVRIVVDGQELNPTDANGNPVQPLIYNGTTYLPVRAVAGAVNKAVYWDGPNFTVYLGEMGGALEYPTVILKDLKNISSNQAQISSRKLTDNYGNNYSSAISNEMGFGGGGEPSVEYLVGMKYSRLKGTLYVPEGTVSNDSVFLTITADGKTIYTSPHMTKTSAPVEIDVNVTGYNDIVVAFSHKELFFIGGADGEFVLCLGEAGFYQ